MAVSYNDFNKNQLQLYFNQIKGEISEINIDEKYSNITVLVGHTNFRLVNLVAKTMMFNNLIGDFKVGDKIIAKFYISSNKKNNRYYTTATLVEIQFQSKIIFD